MTARPFRATCVQVGTQPLFRRAHLGAVLDLVEQSSTFAPTHWSKDERSKEPYSRRAIWDWLFAGGNDTFRKMAPTGSGTMWMNVGSFSVTMHYRVEDGVKTVLHAASVKRR